MGSKTLPDTGGGVDTNAGVASDDTQRMILASDDPAVTALQVMDDWDESDRAKVNPIVGQAGVAAGAGAVGATVQRVTLASDDPAVALLATMDADTGSMVTLLTQIDGYLDTEVAAIVTAAQLLDNIVSGSGVNVSQIGGQAPDLGAGAVGTGTSRTTLASDDPAVTALQVMDDWDESDRAKVNLIAGQAGISGGTGVDGASVPRVTLATDVPLPAGTNALGSVNARQSTDAIMDGTTALTPKFAAISVSSSGDNTALAAVSGKKIRVLSLTLVCAAAVAVTVKSGTGTALTGSMSFGANGGLANVFNPVGLFETASGQALTLTLSGAVQVSGFMSYVEV